MQGGIIPNKDIGRTTGTTTSKDTDLFVCNSKTTNSPGCADASTKRPPFEKIHDALQNTSESGQTVIVYPGVYVLEEGPLTFKNHKIIFRGKNSTCARTTIIDCYGHRCFEPKNKCEAKSVNELELINGKKGSPTPEWNGPYWGSWPFAKKIAYVTLRNG